MALRAGHGRQEQGGGGVSLAAPLGASGAPPRAPACFLGRRESGSAAAGSPAPRASPLRALASAVARASPLCGRVHGRRGRGLSEKHERPVAGRPSRTRGSSWEPRPRPTARRQGARRGVACRPRAAQGGVPRPRHGAARGGAPAGLSPRQAEGPLPVRAHTDACPSFSRRWTTSWGKAATRATARRGGQRSPRTSRRPGLGPGSPRPRGPRRGRSQPARGARGTAVGPGEDPSVRSHTRRSRALGRTRRPLLSCTGESCDPGCCVPAAWRPCALYTRAAHVVTRSSCVCCTCPVTYPPGQAVTAVTARPPGGPGAYVRLALPRPLVGAEPGRGRWGRGRVSPAACEAVVWVGPAAPGAPRRVPAHAPTVVSGAK